MPQESKEYRRLPGKGRRKGSFFAFVRTTARLYVGNDHLLCVYNSGYTEDYRRFYFKDIQAIVAGRNSRRERLSSIYGGAALFLFLIGLLTGGYRAVFFMILAILFLLNLAINWQRGPTCTCQIHTAASQEELPSLGRLKNAMIAIEILKPLIEGCQGKLSPEEIRAKAAAAG